MVAFLLSRSARPKRIRKDRNTETLHRVEHVASEFRVVLWRKSLTDDCLVAKHRRPATSPNSPNADRTYVGGRVAFRDVVQPVLMQCL
jgi:hypothetical protein